MPHFLKKKFRQVFDLQDALGACDPQLQPLARWLFRQLQDIFDRCQVQPDLPILFLVEDVLAHCRCVRQTNTLLDAVCASESPDIKQFTALQDHLVKCRERLRKAVLDLKQACADLTKSAADSDTAQPQRPYDMAAIFADLNRQTGGLLAKVAMSPDLPFCKRDPNAPPQPGDPLRGPRPDVQAVMPRRYTTPPPDSPYKNYGLYRPHASEAAEPPLPSSEPQGDGPSGPVAAVLSRGCPQPPEPQGSFSGRLQPPSTSGPSGPPSIEGPSVPPPDRWPSHKRMAPLPKPRNG